MSTVDTAAKPRGRKPKQEASGIIDTDQALQNEGGAESGSDEDLDDGRKPRELETREHDESIPTTWMPSELLPEPIKQPGWDYRWIRIKFKRSGEADTPNVSSRMREGWRPCTPEEQPQIARFLEDGGKGQSRIVVDEVMLCKIPSELMDQRRAFFAKKAAGQLEGVHAQLMGESDARMPIDRPSVKTTTSKSIF